MVGHTTAMNLENRYFKKGFFLPFAIMISASFFGLFRSQFFLTKNYQKSNLNNSQTLAKGEAHKEQEEQQEAIGEKNASKPTFRLPEVQIIGAQKAGTTTVAAWLFHFGGYSRPKTFQNEPFHFSKEVHIFDRKDRYKRGVKFYAKRFPQPSEGNASSLDATPATILFPGRVRKTYEAAGGNQVNTVKFIVILREPVSRELSYYNHMAHNQRENMKERGRFSVVLRNGSIMSFDEFVRRVSIPSLQGKDNGVSIPALQGKDNPLLMRGMYERQLSKWFEIFDRKQILVLTYHELKNNPEKLQERVQQFLGIEIRGKFTRANAKSSALKITSPSPHTKQALAAIFEPLNENLYQLLEAHPGPPMEETPIRFPQP